jgi:polyadenylate-binding protein
MHNLLQPNITMNNPSTECTLYVGNLNPNLDDNRLFQAFKPFGELVSSRVMRDIYSGESRRFAFVSFARKEEAQKALDALNYTKLDDWELRICFKRSPSDFKPEGNVFVKGFPESVTAKDLNELFKEFGNILSCTVRSDQNGKSLGYGYVQFSEEESSEKAIAKLHQSEQFGAKIEVSKFVASKNRNLEQKNLYLKNFPKSWDKQRIEQFIDQELGSLGKVTSKGVYDKEINGVKKYFAFTAFEETEPAR